MMKWIDKHGMTGEMVINNRLKMHIQWNQGSLRQFYYHATSCFSVNVTGAWKGCCCSFDE